MDYTNPELKQKIHSHFNFKNDGFFVDIGAHDGIALSNTWFLENLGWDGVCIEPHPNVFKKLIQNRKSKCVNCAVWNEDTEVNFLSLSGYTEMLSGIMECYDKRHFSRIQSELNSFGGDSEIIKVEAKKFDSILDRTEIDFLSIDTEGSELQILEQIDLKKFNINLICLENNFFEQKFIDFMNERGYYLLGRFSIDYLFAKK